MLFGILLGDVGLVLATSGFASSICFKTALEGSKVIFVVLVRLFGPRVNIP